MPRNDLEWLDQWYQRQCNGKWEHTQGMRLEMLDNPGWQLTIHLAGTSVRNTRRQRLRMESRGGGWLACSIGEECFEGSGDPRKLEQIIGVFRRWVETDLRTEA